MAGVGREGGGMSESFLNGRVILHGGDNRDVLRGIADSSIDSIVTDLAAGTAAEHIVCADLLLMGYRAFLSDQNCPYDVAVDVDGRLVRIQVKATRSPRSIPQRREHIAAYMWHVRRAGKGGRRFYGAAEFDLLALVALDIRRIAYLAPSHTKQTIHIRPPGAPGNKQFDSYPFTSALVEIAA